MCFPFPLCDIVCVFGRDMVVVLLLSDLPVSKCLMWTTSACGRGGVANDGLRRSSDKKLGRRDVKVEPLCASAATTTEVDHGWCWDAGKRRSWLMRCLGNTHGRLTVAYATKA